MRAEVLIIGNEILACDVLDTNSVLIRRRLSEIGVEVEQVTTVGDEEERICRAIEDAFERAGVVIATGGLGPTHDDVTKRAFTRLFGRRIVLDQEILKDLKTRFERRGARISEVILEQAKVPEGLRIIKNRVGTAPGFHLDDGDRHLFLLPGVPHEMEAMLADYVLPLLGQLAEGSGIHRLTLRTTGIPESELFSRLKALGDLDYLGFLPTQYGVDIRITVKGEKGEEKVQAIAEAIRQRVGEFVYGTDGETMEEVVGSALLARGLKIAVAESCTGGLIANRLTNVPGSSAYFERAVVAYSNESKIQLLKVPKRLIDIHGAVSPEVAEAMASGIREIAGVDIGLSATGIAGPTGATPKKPVGLVYIGLSTVEKTVSERFQFGEERLINKERMAQVALDMVRRALDTHIHSRGDL